MIQASRIVRWATRGLAAIPAVLAGFGARDLAGFLVIVIIVVAALCWVVKDNDRTNRLAKLIRAWRQTSPRTQPDRVLPKASPDRRRRGHHPADTPPPAA